MSETDDSTERTYHQRLESDDSCSNDRSSERTYHQRLESDDSDSCEKSSEKTYHYWCATCNAPLSSSCSLGGVHRIRFFKDKLTIRKILKLIKEELFDND